jgi:hypothetical protein
MKEMESADRSNAVRFRALQLTVESLGAERAAARVKITTHLALSHSSHGLSSLIGATSH